MFILAFVVKGSPSSDDMDNKNPTYTCHIYFTLYMALEFCPYHPSLLLLLLLPLPFSLCKNEITYFPFQFPPTFLLVPSLLSFFYLFTSLSLPSSPPHHERVMSSPFSLILLHQNQTHLLNFIQT